MQEASPGGEKQLPAYLVRADKETTATWNSEWVFTWSMPGKQAEESRRWMEYPTFRDTSAANKTQIHVSTARDVLPLSSLVTTCARTIAYATYVAA